MKILPVFLLATYLLVNTASAAANCTEAVTAVINHSNGNVYFTTDQTRAAGWCQLSGNSDSIKRGYAMLLAAQLSGKKVNFSWPGLSSCSQNALYASPDYLYTSN